MNSINLLLKCFEDIKAWMTINCLNFNKTKTEVMVFGGTARPSPVGLGFLTQYSKLTVRNLGVELDPELNWTARSGQMFK